MFKTILVATVLSAGLATSAMAQGSDSQWGDWSWWHGNTDTTTTGSINSVSPTAPGAPVTTGANGPCADTGMGPDANAGINVNDQYCGK
ncbi:hypothetical protein [Mesorhizobium sp. 1M-11]|uniref:hypothetical protein n=1 Tax=Mesorhizobium sp. 1M-11 TaxID=1529006 RepID=UPI0006C773BC|nr:hypothetical protein [Mesorhizobium sp. 1M-11]